MSKWPRICTDTCLNPPQQVLSDFDRNGRGWWLCYWNFSHFLILATFSPHLQYFPSMVVIILIHLWQKLLTKLLKWGSLPSRSRFQQTPDLELQYLKITLLAFVRLCFPNCQDLPFQNQCLFYCSTSMWWRTGQVLGANLGALRLPIVLHSAPLWPGALTLLLPSCSHCPEQQLHLINRHFRNILVEYVWYL